MNIGEGFLFDRQHTTQEEIIIALQDSQPDSVAIIKKHNLTTEFPIDDNYSHLIILKAAIVTETPPTGSPIVVEKMNEWLKCWRYVIIVDDIQKPICPEFLYQVSEHWEGWGKYLDTPTDYDEFDTFDLSVFESFIQQYPDLVQSIKDMF